jgi:hypothetical protein
MIRKRASILRYTYIAPLVIITTVCVYCAVLNVSLNVIWISQVFNA